MYIVKYTSAYKKSYKLMIKRGLARRFVQKMN